MNLLHLVNGNIIADDGYSQRIKRQENVWKSLDGLNVSLFNISSWKLMMRPRKLRHNIHKTEEYAKKMGFGFGRRQGYSLFAFFYNPDWYFKISSNSVWLFCKKNNIDLIFAENLICGYMAYECYKRYGIPYVLDYHGVAPEEFQLSGKEMYKVNYEYYKKMEKKTIENAKGIVCVSKRFKEYLLKTFNVSEDKIIIAPSCIEESKIGYEPKARTDIRGKMHIPDSTKVIIYAGGCGHWHCDDKIVEIYSKLHKIVPDTYLFFLTNDSNHIRVRDNLEKFGITESNYLLSSVSNTEIFDYYAAADYGIIIRFNSLINEVASPTKVIEYMAAGLGVISTTNVGDINILPGVSYLEDYDELTSEMYDIGKLGRFVATGYDRINNLNLCQTFLRKEYTWESMESRYKKFFDSVYRIIK